jgi:hypothetical protein
MRNNETQVCNKVIEEITINTWQNQILKVCKYCKHFTDRKKSRYRYFCDKNGCHIYHVEINSCSKTKFIRKKAAEISKNALGDAFQALTGAQMPNGRYKEEE